MNRQDLVRRIEGEGAIFIREGARHTVYRNPFTGQTIPVPRHREVSERLAHDMIRDAQQRKPED